MKIDSRRFRVKQGSRVKLDQWPTRVHPYYRDKRDYERRLGEQVEELRALQPQLYAYDRYSLLVIFQAMDAAGKDGAIKHVMSGVNPQGCEVHSFKHPGPVALEHDFLWRTTTRFPERGRIGIFNRSYYEEVLVVRVHRELLEAQFLPEEAYREKVWEGRYESIRDVERHLHRNGTRVIKFFLHLSREEQRKRFLSRLDEPEKNWKLTAADINERQHWDEYMRAYEACLAATSTRDAPWYVVPADDKLNSRLIVSRVIVEALQSLPLSYPKPDPRRRTELRRIRKALEEDTGIA